MYSKHLKTYWINVVVKGEATCPGRLIWARGRWVEQRRRSIGVGSICRRWWTPENATKNTRHGWGFTRTRAKQWYAFVRVRWIQQRIHCIYAHIWLWMRRIHCSHWFYRVRMMMVGRFLVRILLKLMKSPGKSVHWVKDNCRRSLKQSFLLP